MNIDRANRIRGVLLTASGVLILTPDSLLVRLITCDPWTLLFWRGLLQFASLFLFYLIIRRQEIFSVFKSIGWAGLLIAWSYAAGNILFVHSIRTTTAANTLLIVSCAPLIAALLSRIVLKEKTALRTWIAALACMGGIMIIFSGGLAGGSLVGDALALATACLMACSFVMIRRARNVQMIPAVALSGLIMSLIVYPISSPQPVHQQDAVFLFMLGFVIMPLAFGLITLGPRYIPAPEVSLIMLIETVLGPVWVWMVFNQLPGRSTWVGGSIVLAALLAHSLASLQHEKHSPEERAD